MPNTISERFRDAYEWFFSQDHRGHSSLRNDSERNGKVLELLDKWGVDTTRPFSINNGRTFEVVNGVVQTVGYEPILGMDGLNWLVARAQAQNLFDL